MFEVLLAYAQDQMCREAERIEQWKKTHGGSLAGYVSDDVRMTAAQCCYAELVQTGFDAAEQRLNQEVTPWPKPKS